MSPSCFLQHIPLVLFFDWCAIGIRGIVSVIVTEAAKVFLWCFVRSRLIQALSESATWMQKSESALSWSAPGTSGLWLAGSTDIGPQRSGVGFCPQGYAFLIILGRPFMHSALVKTKAWEINGEATVRWSLLHHLDLSRLAKIETR